MFDRIKQGMYWDKPWTLVSGCTRCSPGCEHCWALAMENRFGRYKRDEEGMFIETHPERLHIPALRRKPTVWAIWNDLFHENVPIDFIQSAFDVMSTCGNHIFLLLTKRIERMAAILPHLRYIGGMKWQDSPTPHIWLGVTVCNQAEADEKIPILLQIPAVVRWVSIEPMLGPIDLRNIKVSSGPGFSDWDRAPECLKWIVMGGETGPGARPMHPDWVRSVRDQCQAAGVPFFFKSWGEWCPGLGTKGGFVSGLDGQFTKAGDKSTHEWGNGYISQRVGKKTAGRLLDGREWNELPEDK